MIVRLVMAVLLVMVAVRLYKYVFMQKPCDTCHKRINKEAEVCHHCHTIQQQQPR